MHKVTASSVSACVFLTLLSFTASAKTSANADPYLKPEIVCAAGKSTSVEPAPALALADGMKRAGITSSSKMAQKFGTDILSGYAGGKKVELPVDPVAKDSAVRVASLAMSGMMISAYVAHEMGTSGSPQYASSEYAKYSKIMLERSILPDPEPAPGEDDVLGQINKKMRTAAKQLGELYKIDPIRWYVLGHAYNDQAAIFTAESLLCSASFSDNAREVVSSVAAGAKLQKPNTSKK